MHSNRAIRATLVLFALATTLAAQGTARASDDLPVYLRDRGTGMSTSMFGTYIRQGELLIYPFFEYYRDDNLEYKPSELGFSSGNDFRGKFRASEGILFLSYGVTDRLAVEVEAAVIDAKFNKAADDLSGTPERIHESGIGDVEGQIRVRLAHETEHRPEFFSYFEAVTPTQRDKLFIGTSDWELKLGAGLIRGFSWGTVTLRAAGERVTEDGEAKYDYGEYAVEYLKWLSPMWRVHLGIEGAQDEIALITEGQWHISRSMFLKVNNAFGITSKSTDWAPEVGIMFSVPVALRE